MIRSLNVAWAGLAFLAMVAVTAAVPSALSPALAEDAARPRLPDEHDYQKTLRGHLGTLSESDFEHGVAAKFTQPDDIDDGEARYRHWFLGLLNQPLIGSKRGAPAVNAPAKLFTLAAIESPQGVMQPPLSAEPAAWLVGWDYAGNPYRGSKAMKRRTFSLLVVLMTMLDDQIEHRPELGGNRLDTLAPSVLTLAWPWPAIRDAVPDAPRAAYEAGLRKLAKQLAAHDPKGLQPNGLAVAPVALWTAGEALGDDEIRRQAETLGRRLWSDPEFFHPAGYCLDRGGIDVGYAGSANVFITWAALAAKWPFAQDALEKTYRLKSYLALPEPDGRLVGPTHFNSRLGSDAPRDQWEWGVYRDHAAALVTNEAAWLARTPSPDEIAKGAAGRAAALQAQVNENGWLVDEKRFARNDELTGYVWKYRLWQNWSFPLSVNYASVYCPPDAWARRQKLEADKSPWLKNPWDREPTFVRSLEKEFTFVKKPGYRAIVHSGRVGARGENERSDAPDAFADFGGFGGGQLSAFWTPATGSVVLGRRGGTSRQKNFDTLDTWRLWPIHAISGATTDGKVFTSARIVRPDVERSERSIRVSGRIPAAMLGQERVLDGAADYSRLFTFDADGVRVETKLRSDGKDMLAELYESIPVYLREGEAQPNAAPTTITFVAGDRPTTATADWRTGVTAVRIARNAGVVEIVFDTPRRVKLSPADWTDAYMTRAVCRNILVDLLDNDDRPGSLRETGVSWTIRAIR